MNTERCPRRAAPSDWPRCFGRGNVLDMRLFVLSLLVLFANPSLGAESIDDLKADIDSFARPLVERQVVVGMSIGIIRGGQRAFLNYGQTEAGNGKSPGDDTLV